MEGRCLNRETVNRHTGFWGVAKAKLPVMHRTAYGVVLATLVSLFPSWVAMPVAADAYATVAPSPIYSDAPGLPDNRVYEQVSPADKNGSQAGASTNKYTGGKKRYGFAAGDGNSVLFEGNGPMGDATAGYNLYFVARRSVAGWSTASVLPRKEQSTAETGGTLLSELMYLDPSADLSHAMFSGGKGTYAQLPRCNAVYLRSLELQAPAIPLDLAEIPNPIENCAEYSDMAAPAGGTPNFSTVYFTYSGTLLPEDASRAPHTHIFFNGDFVQKVEAWGFYERRDGVLREAGVLPNGSLDPFGAVPAASGHARALAGNQVSVDGSRAFFVSPDPASCAHQNDCAADPPQLYVRENGERTLLVSRDTLLPSVSGLPAGAPDGAFQMPNSTRQDPYFSEANEIGSYVFASPNGSQAFFQSEDRLTNDAPEGPPGNTRPKTYDFNVNTGSLTYLPNVVGQIVVSSGDGSEFAFVNSSASPAELDLWSAGPGGGTVTPITQLTGKPLREGVERPRVPLARMSSDGSVVVFTSSYHPPGGFNSGTKFEQIYRYDIPTNTLGCVSCPPAGVVPSGPAEMSPLRASEEGEGQGFVEIPGAVGERGASADGSRIFFETPDPLVARDTNTGSIVVDIGGDEESSGRDVYEWENGSVFLLSSGKSLRSSFFLDNSENGGDVFFATVDGLNAGDTDDGYDVYDARVPHPGDNPPPAAVPCQGSVCQGPPRVPTPLGAPASATFSGLGNVTPQASQPAAKPKVKPKRGRKVRRVKHKRRAKRAAAKRKGGR